MIIINPPLSLTDSEIVSQYTGAPLQIFVMDDQGRPVRTLTAEEAMEAVADPTAGRYLVGQKY